MPVPLKTIDGVVAELGFNRLDALLIDVEGFEERALRGAAAALGRFRPMVLVELWPPVMRKQGTTVEAAVDLLRQHDYRLYFARRRHLLPVTELPQGDARLYAFCFHRDRVPVGIGN